MFPKAAKKTAFLFSVFSLLLYIGNSALADYEESPRWRTGRINNVDVAFPEGSTVITINGENFGEQ